MRVTREKAAENRGRIVEGAARLFRERGLAGVGVDELGAAAGLSHGSLYSQFGSKDNLAAEAVDEAFRTFAKRMGAGVDLADYVEGYLSRDHRDHRDAGCAVSALGSEIPRQSPTVRARFTDGIKRSHARIKGLLTKTGGATLTDDQAWATAATLVGSLILARGVDDPDLADRILLAGRIGILGGRASMGKASPSTGRKIARHPSKCSAALMRKASRRLSGLYDSAVSEVGLTTTQYALLVEIERRVDRPPTLRQLAEAMVMDRSDIGHGLRPLQRDGMVKLIVGDLDHRSRHVVLTAAGRARLKSAARHWLKAELHFASTLREDDYNELRSRLISIARDERLIRLEDTSARK